MKLVTIDGVEHRHDGCQEKETESWLHVTRSGRWVASYLRCTIRDVDNTPDDLFGMLSDIFGSTFNTGANQ